MTTPTETQRHPMPAQKQADDPGWRLGRVALLVGVVGLAIGAVIFGGRTITLHDEKDTAVGQVEQQSKAKDDVADRAIAVCKGASAEELARLNAVGLCVAAADAKNQAPPVSASPPPFSVVKSAVDAYFAANPPKAGPAGPLPPEDVILRLVQQVYAANPPADGKTPTDAELLTLIRQVYAANPPADGKDGRNAFCFDNPDDAACQPRQGEPGRDGVSVVDLQLDGSSGTCELVVLFSNDTSRRKAVNPALCGPVPPPSTTTETATVTASEEPLPIPTT